MNEVEFRQMMLLVGSGLGLLVLGFSAAFLRQFGRIVRVGVPLVAACAAASIPFFADYNEVALLAAGVTLAMAILASGPGLSGIERGITRALTLARKSWAPAAGLSVIGVFLFFASLARFEFQQEEQFDDDARWMKEAIDLPTHQIVLDDRAKSDLGKPIHLLQSSEQRAKKLIEAREALVLSHIPVSSRTIRRGVASDESNCHGWVFTAGKHWLNAENVEIILHDNGYVQVSDPTPGDLAVYRRLGVIQHTAIVRGSLDEFGTMVEGKWGWLGVFIHRVDDSCYGDDYQYYRSHRNGHLIAGLPGDNSKQTPNNAMAAPSERSDTED